MQLPQPKACIGNIDAKALILQDIWFHRKKLELAEVDYHKATLNNDYSTLNSAHADKLYRQGCIDSNMKCLRYLLAQEAEASGRRVSADIREFDEFIQTLVNGITH